jgi:hypothetical protein
MPATAREIFPLLGYAAVDRRLAGPSIEAGAYYMAKQRRAWKVHADWSRHRHALASYNAGRGNISRAWKLCERPAEWEQTAICLPEITGRHAKETTTYIQRIWKWWKMMEAE